MALPGIVKAIAAEAPLACKLVGEITVEPFNIAREPFTDVAAELLKTPILALFVPSDINPTHTGRPEVVIVTRRFVTSPSVPLLLANEPELGLVAKPPNPTVVPVDLNANLV